MFLFIQEDGSMNMVSEITLDDYKSVEEGILTIVNMVSQQQCVHQNEWEDLEGKVEDPEKEKLRVWWIPQVPMKSFEIDVKNTDEAVLILKTLADYDIFQLKNNIKPDFCNAGGLNMFDEEEKEWITWYSDEGEEIEDLMYNQTLGEIFKEGEYITGKDRTYPRSLYQISRKDLDTINLKLLALNGHKHSEHTEGSNVPYNDEFRSAYRTATKEEIEKYLETGQCEVFCSDCGKEGCFPHNHKGWTP